jgi:lipid-binding SYLF domain-containing protein
VENLAAVNRSLSLRFQTAFDTLSDSLSDLFFRITMKHAALLSLGLFSLVSVNSAFAGPLRDAASAVGDAVGYVGESVGDTASKIGEGVKDAAKTVTGKNDPHATRLEIDGVAAKTLEAVVGRSAGAKALFDKSYGYAVFDSRKGSFLITTGKGLGVAVRKDSGERTYMHVATLGANLGAGVQFYQGLFLFETKAAFDAFVNQGWQADAGAGATLGKASLEAQAKFTNGMAYYQLSETGILLDATLSGTKYWRSAELNDHA